MTRQNVTFDLDGTLINLYKLFCEFVENSGRKVVDNGCFRIDLDPPTPDDVIWKFFAKCYDDFKRIEVFDGAVELLTKLYEKTKEPPLIVTARPREYVGQTYKHLDYLLDVPYFLAFVDNHLDKLPFMRYKEYCVDDRRKAAIDYSAAGKSVFLINKGYNKIDGKNHLIEMISGVHELIPRIDELIDYNTRRRY